MSREDRWYLFLGGLFCAVGVVVFFGRVSVAEFFGAAIIFGMPFNAQAERQVRIVGWVGAALAVIGLLVVGGTAWRNLPKDGPKDDKKE